MTIRRSLVSGFVAVALLCGIVGFTGLYGTTQLKSAAGESMFLADTRNILKDREIEHYQWAIALKDVFIKNKAAVDVEMDDHQCALGRFLYEGGLKEAGDQYPELAEMLEKIKEPHHALHASAQTIADLWKPVHEGLSLVLMDRLDEHRQWMLQVASAIIKGETITVETDPTACKFGKWLESDQASALALEWQAFAESLDEIKKSHRALHQSVIDINNVATLSEKNVIFNDQTIPAMNTVADRFRELIQKEADRVTAQSAAKSAFATQTQPALNQVQEAMDAIMSFTEKKELGLEAREDRLFVRQKIIIIGVVMAAIALALGLGLGIARYIVNALDRVISFSQALSRGDLSARLDMGRAVKRRGKQNELQEMATGLNLLADELTTKAELATAIGNGDLSNEVHVASTEDTLGHALQNMTTNLNQMIAEIYQAADQVNTSSGHIADSSQSLSQGATEQAASVEEISSSMEEVGVQSQTNADNAGQASQIAVHARESADTSISRMNKMTTSMQAIDESSKEIQKIIKVIDDIAFQTNLLALNAAVEAARAGKHGKGFAVVAQEVRSLAERSAKAAKETETLIDDALHRVADGSEITNTVASALTEMNEQVVKISDILQDISAASREQAQGISQIKEGIDQVDGVTQQNTASAEETAAAAEELSGQAEHVRNTLARFKLKKEALTKTNGADAEKQDNEDYPALQNQMVVGHLPAEARLAQ